MQDQIFPLNLMLKYQAPNWTVSNLHHTTWNQTNACIITNTSYVLYRKNRAWQVNYHHKIGKLLKIYMWEQIWSMGSNKKM